MKRSFTLLLFLHSFGALFAQNINFKDTTALKELLCSHTWIRYYVNPDSTFSDRIMDSIKFLANGTFYEYAKPKDDTLFGNIIGLTLKLTWNIRGETWRVLRSDSATECKHLDGQGDTYSLVDGNRIVGSKTGKICGNLTQAFIVDTYMLYQIHRWDMREIYQARRPIKKKIVTSKSKRKLN